MSNDFEIKVKAEDKFSTTFGKLHRALRGSGREAAQAGRQSGLLARNAERAGAGLGTALKLNQRLASALPHKRIGEALGRPVADGGLGDGLSAVGSGLSMLGPAGKVGAGLAATLAAASALSTKWSDIGASVLRTSSAFKIGTDQLQLYQAAATEAGYSAEGMEASLKGLSRTLYLVQRAPNEAAEAGVILKKLGVNARGSVDAVMQQLTQVFQRTGDVRTNFRIGSALGLSEDTVQMMSSSGGRAGLQTKFGELRARGVVQSPEQLRAAEEQVRALGGVKNDVNNLFNGIGSRTAPWLTDFLRGLTGRDGMYQPAEPGASGGAPAPAGGASAPGVRPSSRPGASAPAPTQPQRVEVEVKFNGAPTGMSATARSDGKPSPVRIRHSGVGQ